MWPLPIRPISWPLPAFEVLTCGFPGRQWLGLGIVWGYVCRRWTYCMDWRSVWKKVHIFNAVFSSYLISSCQLRRFAQAVVCWLFFWLFRWSQACLSAFLWFLTLLPFSIFISFTRSAFPLWVTALQPFLLVVFIFLLRCSFFLLSQFGLWSQNLF